jgi:mannosyltransferase
VTLRVPQVGTEEHRLTPVRTKVGWVVLGAVALGAGLRFATLGIQSYHHDEIITVARVIPGSFGRMLHEVKASESNPPLYYVLAWGWSKAFGSGEIGLRSLSALFGAATIPVAFLAGRELTDERGGLAAAGIVAVNPMLIWYSQEARSYALLVFFGAVALLFFLRALRTGAARDVALWALSSALALGSHYFAVFPTAIEAVWLLVALRRRWRLVLPAIGAVGLVGLALLPLLLAQDNPHHIGWIDKSLLSSRLLETGVSFLAGETGHVIAEPPRHRFALVPALAIGLALLLLVLRGGRRERRGAVIVGSIGLGVVLLALAAALTGHDYIVERNLLPALIPLALVAAIGFSLPRARTVGAFLAVALCAYWVVFDVHVARTANLQRPDFRDLSAKLGPPSGPRAIVSWKLAAVPLRYYQGHGAERVWGGRVPVREIDVVSKHAAGRRPHPPQGFHAVERVRLDRLTLVRYASNGNRIRSIGYRRLRGIPTGFAQSGVVAEGASVLPGGAR